MFFPESLDSILALLFFVFVIGVVVASLTGGKDAGDGIALVFGIILSPLYLVYLVYCHVFRVGKKYLKIVYDPEYIVKGLVLCETDGKWKWEWSDPATQPSPPRRKCWKTFSTKREAFFDAYNTLKWFYDIKYYAGCARLSMECFRQWENAAKKHGIELIKINFKNDDYPEKNKYMLAICEETNQARKLEMIFSFEVQDGLIFPTKTWRQ